MPNNKIKKMFKNISCMVIVNIISLIISFFTVIILPKFMGIKQYSYWQLYIFYTSYIVFLSIGLCDGIYLRYGGYEYEKLPKDKFVTQFWIMEAYLSVVTLTMSIVILLSNLEENKKFILLTTCICGLIYISRVYFEYILQTTNKITVYAKILLIDRISFFTMIILCIALKYMDFKLLIFIDLLIKCITLLYAIIKCRDITFGNLVPVNQGIKEVFCNINAGFKLIVSNLAGVLIIGIVRWGIERIWNVETFGKVSFTLSINNMILVCINAIGLVIFPLLCRVSDHALPSIYKCVRVIVMVILLGILIFCYPMKLILNLWVPQYSDALNYMVLLFPIIIFESRMSLIINPYLKALRKEKLMLIINSIAVLVSLGITTIVIFWVKKIEIAVISITILMAFRCTFADLMLSRILSVKIKIDLFLEIIICTLFICFNWYINSWISVAIYTVVYLLYLAINIKNIKSTVKTVRVFLKQNELSNV